MKQLILIISLLVMVQWTSAQWTPNGTSIYYGSGNVGIGTTAPSHPLHIVNPSTSIGLKLEGASGFAPGLLLHNTAANGKKYSLYSSADGHFIIGDETTLKAKMAIWNSGLISFHSHVDIGYMDGGTAGSLNVNGPVTATSQYISQRGTAIDGRRHFSLNNGGTGSRFAIGLQVEESGGTTGATGSDFRIWRYDNAGSFMATALSISRSSGNVGIGADAVENSEGWAKALGVWGDQSAKTLVSTGNVHTGLWAHDHGFFGAPAGGYTGTWTNHAFSLITNRQSRLTINPAGYVGIGTTTPQERLQVGDRVVLHDGGWKGLLYNLAWDNANQRLARLVSAPVAGMYFTNQGNILFINGPSGAAGEGDNARHSLVIHNSGQVGIGTSVDVTALQDPYYKLFVAGGVRARKVKVDQQEWADYVFEPAYQLRSLREVEAFIQKHHHLPDVPSAREVAEKGLDLGESQAVLLRKVEELTLYIIEQNKTLEKLGEQAQKSAALEAQNKSLEERLRRLEEKLK